MKEAIVYQRSLQQKVQQLSDFFPCVLVTGARQVGKSTLLRSMLPPDMGYVTLDDYVEAERARQDPRGFLERHGTPLCIDEIQYAPELLRAIKMRVDENRRPGMYWLTGSQRFEMMKGVTESLAGRIGIVELLSMSQQEILSRGEQAVPLEPENIQDMLIPEAVCDTRDLFYRIWRGGYPQLIQYPNMPPQDFFNSYLQTYIERDVQALSQIGNKSAFVKFMRSAALRTGQQLIYSDLAKDAEVSPKTIAAWISILQASGIVSLLEPYHSNELKRPVKSPKLYFLDTGLCCWLTGCDDVETLISSHLSGAMLETWVYGQLLRNFTNRGIRPHLYYFRDRNGAEVDFVLEKNRCLYPFEVKQSTRPVLSDLKGIAKIPPGQLTLKSGVIFCTATHTEQLPNGALTFPISSL